MGKMIGWMVRKPNGEWVDTLYYTEDCDADYIRRAEDIPAHYTMKKEDR